MEYTSNLIPRILRDIDDGVLALDAHGCITYMNPQCQSLLGLQEDAIGQTFAQVFFDGEATENDAFHQFVLDAVYKKEKTHSGTVSFTDKKSKRMHLRVTSSYLKSEAPNEEGGVVLVLSDMTEAETQRKKRQNGTVVFSCTIACVCLYLLLLATLDFLKISVPTKALTQVINGMVCVFGFVIYKKTDLTVSDLGLGLPNAKKTLGLSALLSLGVVLGLMGVKLVVIQIAPTFAADAPFWNWNIGLYSWVSYLFTCIIQEFLARSLIYGSIKRMFDGKHSIPIAILLSSLLFGAVHIAHGFVYMLAAILLLGGLGGLYEKQRSIWGVTILHFVLGQAAHCLGFIS